MNSPAPSRHFAAADAALRAARAVAVDPACDPRLAAVHLVDAWTALVFGTWPNEPVPGDSELPARAAALLAGVDVPAGLRERLAGELPALLAERRRPSWEPAAFPLGRAAVDAHVTGLVRVLDAKRRGAGVSAPSRVLALARALVPVTAVLAVAIVALRPWQATGIGPWRAVYFMRPDFTGETVERKDLDVAFDWGLAGPQDDVPADLFSVRWDTCLALGEERELAFQLTSDDSSRLFVDGKRVVENWGRHELRARGGRVRLTAGVHHLRVDYSESKRTAAVTLQASIDGEPPGPLPGKMLHAPLGPFDAKPCG
jgi:hypothetical protein